MLIAGLLCLCGSVAAVTSGLWSATRPVTADPVKLLRRAQAPTQLAAGVMLASGGAVALAAPGAAVVPAVICVAGAIGTVAAGSWQSARYALSRKPVPIDCVGGCAECTRACR